MLPESGLGAIYAALRRPSCVESPMSSSPVHRCGCAKCRAHRPPPERVVHRQINLLVSRLDEPQRRWFVALEAMRLGHGAYARPESIWQRLDDS
jgi:hypothetical protein